VTPTEVSSNFLLSNFLRFERLAYFANEALLPNSFLFPVARTSYTFDSPALAIRFPFLGSCADVKLRVVDRPPLVLLLIFFFRSDWVIHTIPERLV